MRATQTSQGDCLCNPLSEQAADEKRCGREVLHGDESLSLVAKDDLPVSSWRCWWLHEGFRSSMGVTGQSPWLIRGTLVPHAGPLSLPRLQEFGRILKNSVGRKKGDRSTLVESMRCNPWKEEG
ncbi:hypothetical protein BHE74_00059807 [Ensete ventricosum]|nr:hypothetical protein BHE74_00059807 [Ensete ventricosum]